MQKEKKASVLARLMPYARGKKWLFYAALGLSSLSAVLNILPFVFIWLIAKEIFVSTKIDIETVSLYGLLALVGAVVSMLAYFVALMCSHLAAFKIEVEMRRVAMQKIIHMPLGFFDKHSSGKIRKIIDDNASKTHTFLAHQMPDLWAGILAPITLLVLIFVIDWKLGLVSLIPIVLGFSSMSLMMSKEGEKFRKDYMDKLEQMSSEAVEYVRGIPVVKTFGQSVFSFRRFVDSIMGYKEMVASFTMLWNKPMAFYQVIMQSAAFFLVPFACLLISKDNTSEVLSDFIFYALIAPNFTLLLMRMMYFKNHSSFIVSALDRFDAILDYPPMDFVQSSNDLQTSAVEFKNVSFAYDGADKMAISNVSFKVQKGQTLALVGASGGGKTTIARLAARFWDASSGEILIGGENIKNIAKDRLMQKISFVFQNTKLFKTSLRKNITYGKTKASEQEIQRVLDLSQSAAIIENLPNGLDTDLGTNGTYLSGGEQQRISLARAMLKDAPIVLLDEATAFADPQNEDLIHKALRQLSKNKTTILIAHRLSSVVEADQILVMQDGKIAQSGTHESLLNQDGIYKAMWEEYQESIDWRISND